MLRLAEDNFNLPPLGARDVTANNLMNSFDFSLPWIEPTTFVGHANFTTQVVTTTLTSQEGNPYWNIGLPSFPVESIIAGLVLGKRRSQTS